MKLCKIFFLFLFFLSFPHFSFSCEPPEGECYEVQYIKTLKYTLFDGCGNTYSGVVLGDSCSFEIAPMTTVCGHRLVYTTTFKLYWFDGSVWFLKETVTTEMWNDIYTGTEVDTFATPSECPSECEDTDDDGTPDVCDACPDNSDLQTIRFDTYLVGDFCPDQPELTPGDYCGYIKYDCEGQPIASPASGHSVDYAGFECCYSSESIEKPSNCTTDSDCNPLYDGEPFDNDTPDDCVCPDIDNDGTAESSCAECDSTGDPSDPNPYDPNDPNNPNNPNDPDDPSSGCVCPGGVSVCDECGDFSIDDLDPDNDDKELPLDNDNWLGLPCPIDIAPIINILQESSTLSFPYNLCYALVDHFTSIIRSPSIPILHPVLFGNEFIIDFTRFDYIAKIIRFFSSCTLILTFLAAFFKLYLRMF